MPWGGLRPARLALTWTQLGSLNSECRRVAVALGIQQERNVANPEMVASTADLAARRQPLVFESLELSACRRADDSCLSGNLRARHAPARAVPLQRGITRKW